LWNYLSLLLGWHCRLGFSATESVLSMGRGSREVATGCSVWHHSLPCIYSPTQTKTETHIYGHIDTHIWTHRHTYVLYYDNQICGTYYSKTSLTRTRLTQTLGLHGRIYLAWSKVLGFI